MLSHWQSQHPLDEVTRLYANNEPQRDAELDTEDSIQPSSSPKMECMNEELFQGSTQHCAPQEESYEFQPPE